MCFVLQRSGQQYSFGTGLVEVTKTLHRLNLIGLLKPYPQCLGCLGGIGTGTTAAPTDDTASITAKLFAPFTAGEFPSALQAQMLSNLLSCPPSCRVPIPPSFVSTAEAAWADHSSPLLIRESNTSAPLLASLLFTALTRPWPLAPTSELRLTSIWDLIGLGFPEEVGHILKLPLHHTRYVMMRQCPFAAEHISGPPLVQHHAFLRKFKHVMEQASHAFLTPVPCLCPL